MNSRLICRLLGQIVLLIGGAMALSLPWAFPALGEARQFEARGFFALLGAMALAGLAGGVLFYLGRHARGRLLRRETIIIVAFSWLLATLLGAVPYWLSGTAVGVDPAGRPIPMGFFDGIFESASGFTATGATVITDVESPQLVERVILFWRSETHFLGGLGIMVLFVALLGMGSAGKALMLTELPGPAPESAFARTQRTARVFAGIYLGLVVVLAVLLWLQGLSVFDALCQSFGTVATGGFSTYNDSIGHFGSAGVEMTVVVFMILACTNFTLLFYVLLLRPMALARDVEFRTYITIMFSSVVAVVIFELAVGTFSNVGEAFRYGSFQVVSIMTNTGFTSQNFDQWNSFSKGVLLVLMYIGGCAGSTSCSVKVIRYVLFFKILAVELERIYHPTVVRPVRIGDRPLDEPGLRTQVTVYLGLVLTISVTAWVILLTIEPAGTWTAEEFPAQQKLVDTASAVAATINGVGPGLGIVGATENYARFNPASKFTLTGLMLLGRLEIFVLLVMLTPGFWRRR